MHTLRHICPPQLSFLQKVIYNASNIMPLFHRAGKATFCLYHGASLYIKCLNLLLYYPEVESIDSMNTTCLGKRLCLTRLETLVKSHRVSPVNKAETSVHCPLKLRLS